MSFFINHIKTYFYTIPRILFLQLVGVLNRQKSVQNASEAMFGASVLHTPSHSPFFYPRALRNLPYFGERAVLTSDQFTVPRFAD